MKKCTPSNSFRINLHPVLTTVEIFKHVQFIFDKLEKEGFISNLNRQFALIFEKEIDFTIKSNFDQN